MNVARRDGPDLRVQVLVDAPALGVGDHAGGCLRARTGRAFVGVGRLGVAVVARGSPTFHELSTDLGVKA